MVMLSELQRFKLLDGQQRQARPVDLAVALLDGDYPPVTQIIFSLNGRSAQALPWDAVLAVDWRERTIRVADLDAAPTLTAEELGGETLLVRDVLDALLLDLQNRRATRANDLLLEEERAELCLVAAVLARPDWGEVARGAFVPTLRPERAYLYLLVGLMGTTITPYMQIVQQSSLVERGIARRHYGPERVDAYAGAGFANLISIFMIIAAAASLHVAGQTEIGSAAEAAEALEPVAGQGAAALFAVGLLGASLLAAAVLPLATAYAVSEALGVAKGLNLDIPGPASFTACSPP